jgi:ABC-2 type transport system ATP-binding protein
MTIIYTTHYMEEVERLCDRVAIMDEGRILALDTMKSLIGLMGGGVIYVGLAADAVEASLPSIRALPHVQAISAQDGQLKIETSEVHPGLLELIDLCNARNVPILSLEVLEPNLESVFLHLTGKRLRD